MFAKIRILIEHTPRSMTMTDGAGSFALWAHNRFLAYGRLNIIANGSRQMHCAGSFALWAHNRFLAYGRLYIIANGSRQMHTSHLG